MRESPIQSSQRLLRAVYREPLSPIRGIIKQDISDSPKNRLLNGYREWQVRRATQKALVAGLRLRRSRSRPRDL